MNDVPAPSTQHSAPSTQHSALNTQHSALSTQHPHLWLAASLGFSTLFAWRTMSPAFARTGEWVQDDARQHVFWMLRFRDPQLFPNDIMADYFQSVAPFGYTALYWVASWLVDPLMASKLLPFVLGLATAWFTFLFVRRLHPSPVCAFLATVLVSWFAWQHDDLASASPRAFVLPCLAALCWALVSRRGMLAVLITVLGALLYPIGGAICLALMAASLVRFEGSRPSLSRDRSSWVRVLGAVALVALVLIPEQLVTSPFGPTITVDQARRMPEFNENGRSFMFVKEPYRYWIESYRSGLNLRVVDLIFPAIPILYEYAALAFLLVPVLLSRRRLISAQLLNPKAVILIHILGVSACLFLLAHLMMFRLYLPARYVQWTVPFAFAVAGGLALGMLVEECARWVTPRRPAPLAAALALGLAVAVAMYPAAYDGILVRDAHPSITRYLRELPKDVLIAAPAVEADSIPAFAGRRVLAAREHAIPYHTGYYREIRRRLDDLVDAYYSQTPAGVASFADRYGVEYFVVARNAFSPANYGRAWTDQFEPFQSQIVDKLKQGNRFALLDAARRCAVADDGEVAIVSTECLRSL